MLNNDESWFSYHRNLTYLSKSWKHGLERIRCSISFRRMRCLMRSRNSTSSWVGCSELAPGLLIWNVSMGGTAYVGAFSRPRLVKTRRGRGGNEKKLTRTAHATKTHFNPSRKHPRNARGTYITICAEEQGTMSKYDLRGAFLRWATLWGATMRETTLRGATMRGASLRGATLRGTTLRRATLRGTTLRGAYLGNTTYV